MDNIIYDRHVTATCGSNRIQPQDHQAHVRIAFIITGLGTGGAETMLVKLLNYIDRRRYSIVVVSLSDSGSMGSKIESLGIPLYTIGMRRGRIQLTACFKLLKLLDTIQPHIVQGWMYHGNLAAQLISAFLPCKPAVLWNVRGDHTHLRREKRLTAAVIWANARLSKFPAFIINNSLNSAEDHEKRLGFPYAKRVIIPNGFETDRFVASPVARKRIRLELGIAEDVLLIGLIGRYHSLKDHATFLHAAGLLLKRQPAVHFLMAGEQVNRENIELTSLIEKWTLQQAVHLLGKREDVPDLMASLDIAALTSISEGFPNVVGEAMSCEVPCTVTDVGDAAWLVGETGKVVSPRDPEGMAVAMESLIAMGAQQRAILGQNARARIIDLFSVQAIARQYEQIYERVMQICSNR